MRGSSPEMASACRPAVRWGRFLLRRSQLASKPASQVGIHWIARNDHRANAAAFLALERAVIKAERSWFDHGKGHPGSVARRTGGPLDDRKAGWADRLILGHSTSRRWRERYRTLGHRKLPLAIGDGRSCTIRAPGTRSTLTNLEKLIDQASGITWICVHLVHWKTRPARRPRPGNMGAKFIALWHLGQSSRRIPSDKSRTLSG
jgi:hypothetical protein